MKNKITLAITLALAAILVVVGVTVWAGPSRQGTVPTPEDEVDLVPGAPVSLGTVEVTCGCAGRALRVEDPEEDFGPAPDGLNFLADGVTVLTDDGCRVEVCYPYPTEVEEKDGNIYKWDEENEEWDITLSEVSGDPARICVVDDDVTEDTFVLIGK